ncbi:hypothetical protein [Bradyrhizobium sp. 153]|uniref:hypothetical protein n=1 Tax=Bradyrhizobium sp. 153 TaxID=2782627 RepID=UPI0031F8F2A0|nr:AMP-binding protein [Bradyrhizobium sp. 153]
MLKPKEPGLVMTGYWGEPERTAEVLRDGCVYTGDLGMLDEDGNFYFMGRKKDAMRRRGENVSAWEVERVINTAPEVEESAVMGVDAALGEQEILAVIKLRMGASLIRSLCRTFAQNSSLTIRFHASSSSSTSSPAAHHNGSKKEIVIDLESAWDAEKAGVKPTRVV